jgi:hypothetical protein
MISREIYRFRGDKGFSGGLKADLLEYYLSRQHAAPQRSLRAALGRRLEQRFFFEDSQTTL